MKTLKEFLDASHSLYHAIANVEELLLQEGYTWLSESEEWVLNPGEKYYVNRGGSALIAFRVPETQPKGFLLTASHADRPCFKVKENGVLEGKYTRLATEKYGGMVISTWLDRPLSVAGRVVVETEKGIQSRLVDIPRDLLLIPNVAIHLNRKVNEGYAWNPAVDTLPLAGSEESKAALWAEIEKAAGGKILGHDLYLYLREKASIWGVEEEFISAQGLDDLQCVWGCTQGFLTAGSSGNIPVLCVFDSEEVGSCSAQGAGSRLLESVLNRICRSLQLDADILLSNSFMVSADNAHALHPNHPELSDSANAPVINGGIVLKFNAGLRYATDGVSAAVLRKLCQKAGVPVQTYYNRADLAGGATLGSISIGKVSIPVVDIGLPQLAMHSAYETAGVRDGAYLIQAMAAYFGSALQVNPDGTVTLE